MTDIPWEVHEAPIERDEPAMLVDLRRCIGCHACSVACKVEHDVPLGEFRMRVRWMESPSGKVAFLPVFAAESCDYGEARATVGMPPACVGACPTGALVLADLAAPSPAARAILEAAEPLTERGDTKPGVLYRGHEAWQETKLNRGVALDPRDADIIYEQSYGEGVDR
ncbi:MAG: hypothetical protein JRF61_16195 [Deltaproteobacteria bacterium]|jgi:Fe-S-cluster-containing dehydrogenase component|nr:hypothetical protein [Deltaproteobacteria bacterium]